MLRPDDYKIIDGDTIKVIVPLRPDDNFAQQAFSIRLRSIAAPEKHKPQLTDQILKDVGIDPWERHPGKMASDALKQICRRKTLLIEPRGVDDYGRLLADVTTSGSRGQMFDLEGAKSVEHQMLELRVVTPFSSDVTLPPHVPLIVLEMRDDLKLVTRETAIKNEPASYEFRP